MKSSDTQGVPTKSERNPALDIAKGLGILLVVIGHHPWVVETRSLSRLIFTFHVPLFIFLSGVFMQDRLALWPTAKGRARVLLKPYFVIMIGLLLVDVALRGRGVSERLESLLYGTGGTLTWIPLWFLPYLWLVTLASLLIWRATSFGSLGRAARLVWLALILVAGVWALRTVAASDRVLFDHPIAVAGLPWSLDLVLIGVFYFLLGRWCRDMLVGITFSAWKFWVSLLAFAVLYWATRASMDLNMRGYDNLVLSTVAALLGISMTVQCSAWLVRCKRVSQALRYIGQATLIILIFHSIPQQRTFELLQAHAPGGYVLHALAALIVGVGLPLLIYAVAVRSRVLSALLLAPKRTPGTKP